MRRRISEINSGATQHIYQRAKDQGIIFYSVEDRLVYYTIASVKAKRYNVVVSSAAIMFTHIHQGVQAGSIKVLRKYLHDTNTTFARLYNHHYAREGRLFERFPGHSQKNTSKDQRSNLIYVYNNHVEKKLCEKAAQERWSFLAYATSTHPFSTELNIKKASKELRKAVRLVDRRVLKRNGLEYKDLDKILPNLDSVEYEQFIDYTISCYAWIDFNAAISMFGSFEAMETAINSTTGGEYTIKEEYSPLSDKAYCELISLAEEHKCIDKIFKMTPSAKEQFARIAFRTTSTTMYHLRKFLHVPNPTKG